MLISKKTGNLQKNINVQLLLTTWKALETLGSHFYMIKIGLELSESCPSSQSSSVPQSLCQAQLTHLGSLLDPTGIRVCNLWQEKSGTRYCRSGWGQRYKALGI